MLKHFLVILNPHSGKGKGCEALDLFKAVALHKGVTHEVFTTQRAGDAVTFLQQHTLEGVDAIISIGGDGSLNEVVNGLLRREDHPGIPVGVLPSGTGNSLMKDMDCSHASEAIADIFIGNRSFLDVFEVEMDGEIHFGFNMVGCGLPAEINEVAERFRFFRGQRYNVAALKTILNYKPLGYHFYTEDGNESFVSDFIVASNTRNIGTGLKIAPHALLDDGLLDIFILKAIPHRFSLFTLFAKLLRGTHQQDARVILRRLSDFRISSPSRKLLNIDGEQYAFNELRVKMLPGRIELLHQPEGD
ncbi:diacylglycerol kinase family lipid kinase [Kiritimatiellota bacterium B12222]|nr:diacylglycerol kinase family lipid kinase [Kiritimatiellota bacterium B12222]